MNDASLIKFCACLKKNTVETILLLQKTIENEVLGVSTIKSWHKVSLDDRKLVKFKLQSGKLKTVHAMMNINTVATVNEQDCHQSLRALVIELKINLVMAIFGKKIDCRFDSFMDNPFT